jgi:tRNA threonylcarbamoyl adenosine modification protein YeaZ
MKTLALEFSSSQRSVAVVQPGHSTAAPAVAEAVETNTRTGSALGMIAEVLKMARLEREQIECIAIGLGPGSYTGIRSAISTAQGWLLARPTKLLGISSADCIAAQSHEEGLRGKLAVVIDAQRGEFYLGRYELDEPSWRTVSSLKLASPADVQQCMDAGEVVVGPEAAQWFPGSRQVFPRAAMLGQLALGRNDFVDGDKIAPIYLRQTTFIKAPPPRVLPT